MNKFFWAGPGYYAGYQYDTAYDGTPMIAYYHVGSKPEEAAGNARSRQLGTAAYYATPPQGAAIA